MTELIQSRAFDDAGSIKPHGEIEGVDVLGQGADRDKIDAGLGEAADGLQGDVAGDLQLGPPGRDGDSLLHHGDCSLAHAG